MGNNNHQNNHSNNNNVIIEAASKNTKSSSNLSVPHTTSSIIASADNDNNGGSSVKDAASSAASGVDHDDRFNYALLLALYTLQGIPMGLSASIPFLIQQKVQMLASSVHHASAAAGSAAAAAASSATPNNSLAELTKMAYNAQAIFALCSWPFSLKLLWAPIVDACFSKKFGRRKSWLVPIQLVAGILMVGGSGYVESELGLENVVNTATADVVSDVVGTNAVAVHVETAKASTVSFFTMATIFTFFFSS